MKIKLNRPLCIFDIESTGVNPQEDRIVEISIIKMFPDGTKESKTRRVNPTVPIPKEASDVHGIKDQDVKNELTFKAIARSLKDYIQGCDFASYNSNRFDVPMLLHEFERSNVFDALDDAQLIDVFNIYCHFNPRTLEAAYSEYCGKLVLCKLDSHKAEQDAKATLEILEAIILEHNDEIESLEVSGLSELGRKSQNIDLLGVVVRSDQGPVFSIGKHKGKKVKDYPDYCNWILNSDLSQNTKKIIKKILKDEIY